MNALPSVCKFSEIFLFTDDTSNTAIDKQQQEFQTELDSLENWLKTNSLALIFEKTVKVNLINITDLTFEIGGTQIESRPVCNYLGVCVDFKLCFNTHINVVLEKFGKQSEIVSKLRHCLPRSQLIFSLKQSFSQLFNMYSIMVAAATLAGYLF